MSVSSSKPIQSTPIRLLWLLLFAAYAVYAGVYIFRTSFVIDGKRFFCLFDDAMISMQYARNLAHGHGLVFNPGGARVEGFTNLLWVLYMSLWHALPIPIAKISLCIQVSAVIFLLANLHFVRRIGELLAPDRPFVALAAAALTAFYLPLNTWSLQGMEVGILALLTTFVVHRLLVAWREQRCSRGAYALLGIGTLIRPDMVVPFAAATLYLAAFDRNRRKQHLLLGGILLALFVAGQTIFRVSYFGDWLPNTYYLKVTGYPFILRIIRGSFVMLEIAWKANPFLVLLPFGFVLFRKDVRGGLLLWLLLAQAAYSVYVGGDAWEWWGGSNRYVCVVMPLFFVLLALAIGWAADVLHDVLVLRARGFAQRTARLRPAAAVGLFLLSLCSFNTLNGSLNALAEWALIADPFQIRGNQTRVNLGLHIRSVTSEKAKVAVVYAGAIPYFMERETIDLLGKMDRRIAREKMRTIQGVWKFVYFYPGHLKWNYAYSIKEQRPDVVAQLWWGQEEAMPILDQDYVPKRFWDRTYYVRKDSTEVRWDRI